MMKRYFSYLFFLFFKKKIINKMKEDYNENCPFDFYVYDVLIKLIESEKEDVLMRDSD